MRPVCVNCKIEMRCETTGATVVETYREPPTPYRIWLADVFQCPRCYTEAVTGYGDRPIWTVESKNPYEPLTRHAKRVIWCYEREPQA